MADIKISQLPSAQSVTGSTVLPVVQCGTTQQATVDQVSAAIGTYGNANVAANLAAFGSNPITTTGNVSGGNLLASGVVSATGNVHGGNVNTDGQVVATGNISGGNVLTGGVVSATGNVRGGNINTAGDVSVDGRIIIANSSGNVVSAAGNIAGQYFIGNGSMLTGISGGGGASTGNWTFTGNTATLPSNANAVISTSGVVCGSPVTGTFTFEPDGTLITDTLLAGDLYVANTIITPIGGSGYCSAPVVINGELSVTGNVAASGRITVASASGNVISTTGNIAGQYFIGNGALLTGISSGSSNTISNGTSNVAISTSGGNITGFVGGTKTLRLSQGAVAVGASAGDTNQGTCAVAVGAVAGGANQGAFAIAIGQQSGVTNQGTRGIAIGQYSGWSGQGSCAVAIGYTAGNYGQGHCSVAIGRLAGQTNQPNNSIIINATGSAVNGSTACAFYVAPIRACAAGSTALYYCNTTKEVTVGPAGGGSSTGNWTFTGNTATLPSNASAIISTSGTVCGSPVTGTFTFEPDGTLITDTLLAGDLYVANTIITPMGGSGYCSSPVVINGSLSVTGSITVASAVGNVVSTTGNISAGYLFGNASQLTGLSSTSISNGTSNVAISTSGGNISGFVAGTKTLSLSQGAVAVGAGAGGTNQGSCAVAIGPLAGQTNQQYCAIAIGHFAGASGQIHNAIAVGASAGANNQGACAIAIGQQSGGFNQGTRGIAIGQNAGNSGQGSCAVAIGISAGNYGQGHCSVAIGHLAGQTNQPNNSIIINATGSAVNGSTACAFYVAPIRCAGSAGSTALYYCSTTKEVTAGPAGGGVGNAITCGSSSVQVSSLSGIHFNVTVACAPLAVGRLNNGQIAFGVCSGATCQGAGTVAIGSQAGQLTQGDYAVAIGQSAGQTTQATGAVAMGYQAGATNQGGNAIAIGRNAGLVCQGANAIAIGFCAGYNHQQPNTIILNATGCAVNSSTANAFYVAPIRSATGTMALAYNPCTFEVTYAPGGGGGGGGNAISCGSAASITVHADTFPPTSNPSRISFTLPCSSPFAMSNPAGNIKVDRLSLGFYAGSSQGQGAVAIGTNAGTNQGTGTVAIGCNAGQSSQQLRSVAVGQFAGQSCQQCNAVAIGGQTAVQVQGSQAVAIGAQAGYCHQGANAIAIGASAGYSNQPSGTIIINATGSAVNGVACQTNAFYVKPIRNATSGFTNTLGYSPTTGEIIYATGTPSDIALKENIQVIGCALAKTSQARGVTFNWKACGRQEIGVIAQEIEQVFPELVTLEGDGYKSVKYENLTAVLLEAVKELKTRVETLEGIIARNNLS